jgi:hypothetical protein
VFPALPRSGHVHVSSEDAGFFARDRKQPYAQRWSFGIQRQLPADFMLDTWYAGDCATRVKRNINYLPAQYLSPDRPATGR